MLKTHCVGAEAASTLIQFVASDLLSSVEDHVVHEARVDSILRQAQLCSPSTLSCLASVDNVLSAPLEIPDTVSVSVGRGDNIGNAE